MMKMRLIRSKELSVLYEKIAKKYGCIFFDAAKSDGVIEGRFFTSDAGGT
ncbi:MAG: hypothetical protein ACLVIY_03495 [Anaerobutyricum soehngenii]